MKQFWQSLIRKLTGKEIISQKEKLRFLVLACLLVHVALLELFVVYYVFPMVMYNMLVIAFYLYVHSVVKRNQIIKAYVLTFMELVVQILLGTMMVGWSAGFFLYIFCIVPVSFFMLLSLPNMRTRLMIPVIITVISLIGYIMIYMYSQDHDPYFVISRSGSRVIYLFNVFVTFILLGILCYCFVLEMLDSQNVMEMKNQNLGHIASVDPLTGLLNRRSMEVMLEEAMERAKQKGTLFSLMMGDIDNFKRINDTYGHECGDHALVHVSEIMRSCVREGDVICRWGGEEFLILVQGNLESAVAVAERIRITIEKEIITYQETPIPFTMTFGVTTYVPGYRMETLIRQADDHLYTGKTTGKNKVVA